MLDDYWAQFQSAQVAIEATCDPKDIDMQVIEMVNTEKVYMQTKSTIKGFMKRYFDEANQRRQNQQPNQQLNQQINNSRLPKLEVPQFDGQQDNFEPAWNALKDRYDNRRLIITSHLNLLFEQPKLTTE
ncbi:hypothetical protein Bhyg_07945 [Pseudolycoriella hygida]|uniref:Uncharacterized protein n=1 Tax=Pseudolycoriella hygida TaxID=35572 RepID=A0A9Q0S367_9DIPT|nr:hypothetical protein Bhyg_07945 [Pseudolycoriella hygida]